MDLYEIRLTALAYVIQVSPQGREAAFIIQEAKMLEEYLKGSLKGNSNDEVECLQDAPNCSGDSSTCVCGEINS